MLPEIRNTRIILRNISLKFIDRRYKYIGNIKTKTIKFKAIKLDKLKFKLNKSPLNKDILSVFKNGINLIVPLNILNFISIKNSFTIILEKRSKDTNAKTYKNIIKSPNFNKISLNINASFNFNIIIERKLEDILKNKKYIV